MMTLPLNSVQVMLSLAVARTISLLPCPRCASLPPGQVAAVKPVFCAAGQPQVARFDHSWDPPVWQYAGTPVVAAPATALADADARPATAAARASSRATASTSPRYLRWAARRPPAPSRPCALPARMCGTADPGMTPPQAARTITRSNLTVTECI